MGLSKIVEIRSTQAREYRPVFTSVYFYFELAPSICSFWTENAGFKSIGGTQHFRHVVSGKVFFDCFPFFFPCRQSARNQLALLFFAPTWKMCNLSDDELKALQHRLKIHFFYLDCEFNLRDFRRRTRTISNCGCCCDFWFGENINDGTGKHSNEQSHKNERK